MDKGIYYSRDDSNEMRRGYGLWLIPASAYSGGGEPVDPPAPVGPADDQAAALAFNGVYDASIPAVKSAKVKSSKKSFTASWKKQSSKKLKKFQKVEIQCSMDKTFPMDGTTVKFAKKSKTSCKVKGLSKKKTYWVRMRNVKFVNGTKYVGKWTKAKKIKTK